MIVETVKRNAAMFFADLGYSVIPCIPNTLRILSPLCLCDATTDKRIIREWWTRWPMANIGLRTDEIVVFDIATKAGVLKLGKLDPPVQKIPGGGYQAFFRRPVREEPPRWPGVHSGTRAYVVVGPSRTRRGMIRWLTPINVVSTLPEWAALMVLLEEQDQHTYASV